MIHRLWMYILRKFGLTDEPCEHPGTPTYECITCGVSRKRHLPCLCQDFRMVCPRCKMRI